MTTIYRADTIGSLLRPACLKEARKAWHAGALPTHEFKRIEDRAVNEAIALQEAAGLEIVTDGEMRRLVFTGTLTEAIDGLSSIPSPAWHWHGQTPEEEMDYRAPVCVTGKIRRRRSLATEEFAYARGKASKPLKMTLPSPLMLALFWSPEHSTAAYSDPFALFADAVDILRQEVRELAGLGCQYIQIDAPELATLVDESQRRATYEARGVSPERMLGEGVEMLNAIADAPGITFGLHMCRGNNEGHWMSQGGYEAISKQVFQRATKYDIFLLEYDDWRSGSFEPLGDIPRDKTVVLGLVSTKKSTVEPADGLITRIEEASRYFPREHLALSTQCGFASVIGGNPITEAVQEAKLRLVVDVAHRVWA
ncbi:MAG: cobalamin-independent methionine synthase II family protein [Deltaproteobacteria bacterium]|nr:cobalamin-independent methionine synthase II family protein [Deltaproteobacteria bacterium]